MASFKVKKILEITPDEGEVIQLPVDDLPVDQPVDRPLTEVEIIQLVGARALLAGYTHVAYAENEGRARDETGKRFEHAWVFFHPGGTVVAVENWKEWTKDSDMGQHYNSVDQFVSEEEFFDDHAFFSLTPFGLRTEILEFLITYTLAIAPQGGLS